MKNWVEEYKRLTLRTWWVSLLGAILALELVFVDVEYFIRFSSYVSPEVAVWDLVLWEFALLVPVLAAIVFRIWTVFSKKTYSAFFISTLAVLILSGLFFGYDLYRSVLPTVPSDGSISYTIYDATLRVSATRFVGPGYIIFGGVRLIVTAIAAFIGSRSKLM